MAESIDTAAVVPERLQRGFSFRSALSLAFADVSPIAARLRDLHARAVRRGAEVLLGVSRSC